MSPTYHKQRKASRLRSSLAGVAARERERLARVEGSGEWPVVGMFCLVVTAKEAMNVTCPTCGAMFAVKNPVSQAGGRKGGKAKNARKGFGSWTAGDWKRHKARRKAGGK